LGIGLKQHPHRQNIPIIAHTAYNSLAVEKAAKVAGCSGSLTKAANIKQLRATIYQQLQTAVVNQFSQQQVNGI
jgi:CheY-like chemotaxis protein